MKQPDKKYMVFIIMNSPFRTFFMSKKNIVKNYIQTFYLLGGNKLKETFCFSKDISMT